MTAERGTSPGQRRSRLWIALDLRSQEPPSGCSVKPPALAATSLTLLGGLGVRCSYQRWQRRSRTRRRSFLGCGGGWPSWPPDGSHRGAGNGPPRSSPRGLALDDDGVLPGHAGTSRLGRSLDWSGSPTSPPACLKVKLRAGASGLLPRACLGGSAEGGQDVSQAKLDSLSRLRPVTIGPRPAIARTAPVPFGSSVAKAYLIEGVDDLAHVAVGALDHRGEHDARNRGYGRLRSEASKGHWTLITAGGTVLPNGVPRGPDLARKGRRGLASACDEIHQ